MKRFILTRAPSGTSATSGITSPSDNIEAADRVIDALEDAMIKLAKNPGIGHWREEPTDRRHRFFPSIRT